MSGDGVLATFDGPALAVRCAVALGDAPRPLGLMIRAGLHAGDALAGARLGSGPSHLAITLRYHPTKVSAGLSSGHD